jgi:molybdate transport system regulatory protein
MSAARLTVRVDFGGDRSIGPGKIRLLEAVHKTGSIARAGRALGMSYRRAWLLIDDLNRCFREAVVRKKPGGTRGGGALVTAFGRSLIKEYRFIEARAAAGVEKRLHGLERSLRDRSTRKPRKRSIRPAARP